MSDEETEALQVSVQGEGLTLQDLKAWRDRLNATTPGEWKCWNGYGPQVNGRMGVLRIGPDDPHCLSGLVAGDARSTDIHGTRGDIEFVAFAHNNLAELLDDYERLRLAVEFFRGEDEIGRGLVGKLEAENAALREQLDQHDECYVPRTR